MSSDDLWRHALDEHHDQIPTDDSELRAFRSNFENEATKKQRTKDDSQPRKPTLNEATRAQPEPPPHAKRPLGSPAPTGSLSGLRELNIRTPQGSDIAMKDVSDDSQTPDQPRKRAALGDGISAGSASPLRESSASPPPRRSKARPTSAPDPAGSEAETRQPSMMFDTQRPPVGRKQLWTPDHDVQVSKAAFDPSNIASIQGQKSRAQAFQQKNRKSFQSPTQTSTQRLTSHHHSQSSPATSSPNNKQASTEDFEGSSNTGPFDIMLQPETRPISQEQLVAEVKGIYAGLVMVEAKCIEVDNKQAALAQADTSGAPPKLNHEQWQALIALHRTLLHEHHDFFLASQHPSASPALRRLASKYAMPARMWRHGIHSFLELLRHRLPASLDHMLAFIYLAYSMMALLYETVPAFEDTWIECLGDLGRYRMAIEDDDIRDREVWTGCARHWYSKASDKAPTTGRLYHHLAILARPNALQQLFYYAKSLCVAVPFTSARESILTLFDPVLNADNNHGQQRLPAFDAAFVKSHGLLFKDKDMDKFDSTVHEFLGLLDNQIGRVTRKFMEQGYHIAIANIVAMLSFANKENVLMQTILPSSRDGEDVPMEGGISEASMSQFRNAQRLCDATSEIVFQRIGDPNVLPFIHVTLVFVYFMSRRPGAMGYLQASFPWAALSTMLNTLMGSYSTPGRLENEAFPSPEKDDTRPFPEDFAMRGLLWADNYFPDEWFTKEKIDEAEKYQERPSMTAQRKERILWLACRVSKLGSCMAYDGKRFSVPSNMDQEPPSRASTFASATTVSTRTETWKTRDIEESDAEEDFSSPTTMEAADDAFHD